MVGAYVFAPYFETEGTRQFGITEKTVRILNSLQKDYVFEIVQLPPQKRYQFFEKKRVDLYLFEDPAWEWSKYRYDFIPLDIEDGEVYVTKKGGAPSPRDFSDLKKMKIAIVKGFHYGFAGLDADERSLRKNFQVELVADSAACISLIIRGTADVTVVAKSFVYDFLKKHPEHRDKLVMSKQYDAVYKLGVILNPEGRIPRRKMEPLIEELKKRPEFIKLIAERFEITK